MGIDLQTVKYLATMKRAELMFGRTLTIGRQSLYLPRSTLSKVDQTFSLGLDLDRIYADKFADELLLQLGASTVSALDASDYEDAELVHDLNLPIANGMKRKYDFVIDGGSLEHVFNVPVALKNIMEMVEVGGHLLMIHPANNFFGHGFYQFSPDLYFRTLTEGNGFNLQRVVACELRNSAPWFEVIDPMVAHRRVKLVNRHRVHIIAHAVRTSDLPILLEMPQQIKYDRKWKRESFEVRPRDNKLYQHIKFIGESLVKLFKPAFNPKIFKRLDSDSLTKGEFKASR